MNLITVKINGAEYNLKGEENEEYLHKIAHYVDKKLKNIMGNNPKLSTTSAAVLTAINCIDELYKCDKAYSELEELYEQQKSGENQKEKELLAQIEALKNEMEHIKASTQKYISENNALKEHNKDIKFKLQSSRYKIMDLEKKLIDNQVNLAVIKKNNNSFLK
jgi:Uncharacterized protein conserved in bacteria